MSLIMLNFLTLMIVNFDIEVWNFHRPYSLISRRYYLGDPAVLITSNHILSFLLLKDTESSYVAVRTTNSLLGNLEQV